MDNFRAVSKSVCRVDAWDKVIGKTLFGADIRLPNLLHAAVLRSPYHHAKIKNIRTDAARSFEGVVAVVTGSDIPGAKYFGPEVKDKPVLAYDVVRHIGDAVAIVVARTKEIAVEALQKIDVDYEELPAVLDPLLALRPDSTKVHPEGNLLREFKYSLGDINKGFLESDIVVERTFEVQRISPGYLEPEVSTARWLPNGELMVWSCSQMPFNDRLDISEVLNIPEEKVKVISPAIGGSFGGKSDSTMALLSALASWASKGNVSLVHTREESMVAYPKRHPGVLKFKVGAKKNGTLVALSADMVFNTGAYASYGLAVGAISVEMATGPYRIPNVTSTSKVVYTNTPISGTVRGPAGPQTSFAFESMMDILAQKLGIDPIEFRKKNAWRKNDSTFLGLNLHDSPSLDICLDQAKEARKKLLKKSCPPGKLCGVGVASSLLKMGMGKGIPDESITRIEWLPSGKVLLWLGSPDIGQGLKTVGAQMTSDLLGVSIQDIELAELNTSLSPKGCPTNTSRTTVLTGNSLVKASKNAIDILLDYAAEELGKDRESLTYSDGKILFSTEKEDFQLPFAYFTSKAAEKGRRLFAEGASHFSDPEDAPKNFPVGLPHVKYCFGAHVARVEVDPKLGIVEVTDYVAIHDVGKAINPMSVEGQIQGGVAMGIGYALMEEMKLRPNGTWVDNFSEYIMPTAMDIPNIIPVIVEHPDQDGPFGSKGVGEPVNVAVAPAIANAVFNATGKRIMSLPIKPDDLIGDFTA